MKRPLTLLVLAVALVAGSATVTGCNLNNSINGDSVTSNGVDRAPTDVTSYPVDPAP